MFDRFPFNRLFRSEHWAVGLDPWNRKLYRRVRTVAPACLHGFGVTAAHGDGPAERVRWGLACRCGERTGRVLGYSVKDFRKDYDGPDVLIGPLAFCCSACGKTTEMFDSAKHGLEAEFGKRGEKFIDTNLRGSGERQAIRCPECEASEYDVIASFMFAHFDHIDDEPGLEPWAQDFFDSFGCIGRCESCGTEWLIAGFELA